MQKIYNKFGVNCELSFPIVLIDNNNDFMALVLIHFQGF